MCNLEVAKDLSRARLTLREMERVIGGDDIELPVIAAMCAPTVGYVAGGIVGTALLGSLGGIAGSVGGQWLGTALTRDKNFVEPIN